MGVMKLASRLSVILLGAFVIVLLLLNINTPYSHPYLLAIFNSVFLGATSIIVAFLAAKTYLETHFTNALFLICGRLTVGLGSAISGWLMYLHRDINVGVIIFTVCALCGGIFDLSSAILESRFHAHSAQKMAIKELIRTICGVTAFVFLLTLAAIYNIIPPFFGRNGFTMPRSITIISAIAIYFAAAMISVKNYWHSHADYIFWYYISLIAFALGLAEVTISNNICGIISWIGIISTYLSGVFFIFSILAISREARDKGAQFTRIMSDFFADPQLFRRSLVETLSDAVILTDGDLRILYLNSTAEKLFQISERQAMHVSFLTYFAKSDQIEDLHNSLCRIAAEDTQVSASRILETQCLDKKGRRFPVELSLNTRVLASGSVTTCIIRDISERKKDQSTIQKQSSILRAINSIYEKSFSSETVETLGKTCLEIIKVLTGSKLGLISEIDGDGLRHDIVVSNEYWDYPGLQGAPDNMGNSTAMPLTGPFAAIFRSGRGFYMNNLDDHPNEVKLPAWHMRMDSFLGVPFIQEGKVTGIVSVTNRPGGYSKEELGTLEVLSPTVMEVLLHKRDEIERIKSETLLKTIIESTPDLIYIRDTASHVVLCNCRTTQALAREDSIARDASQLVNTCRGKMRQNDQSVMAERKSMVFEETAPDGRIYLSTKTPWLGTDGSVTGVIGISRDISDRIRMERELVRQAEELKAADRKKNDFINALSHELRNPLATVVAALSLLDISADPEQKEQARTIIRRQIKQLCRLAEDLLDETRITRGKFALRKERLELCALALCTAESQRSFFDEKGVHLTAHIYTEQIWLEADPVRLTQMLGNLLQNALKFSRKGGETRILVEKQGNSVIIRVQDDGVGIPEDFLPHLFEPFMQADHSPERKNSGLGLGLSIVKSIVELHGGSIHAFSAGIGKGTEVTVCLPAESVAVVKERA